jgi:hypothetical protein
MTESPQGRPPEQDEDWSQVEGPEPGSEEHRDLTREAEGRADENTGRDNDANA